MTHNQFSLIKRKVEYLNIPYLPLIEIMSNNYEITFYPKDKFGREFKTQSFIGSIDYLNKQNKKVKGLK